MTYHFKKSLILFLLLPVSLAAFIWLQHYYALTENSGYLADYKLYKGPLKIAQSAGQSSGLAFNPDNEQLYVVVSEPPEIHVLSAKGKHLYKIELAGFEDTEGITYISNNQFALVSERKGIVSWFTITDSTRVIHFDPARAVTLFSKPVGNTGLEGISYAGDLKKLLIIKERKPKKIYALSWPVVDIMQPELTFPWDAELEHWWSNRGLSGVYYHQKTGHVFILSRRSRRIIEYTLQGKEVGSFALKTGSGSLPGPIKKAEGIVFSDDGTLYLCAEHNEFYIFKKSN